MTWLGTVKAYATDSSKPVEFVLSDEGWSCSLAVWDEVVTSLNVLFHLRDYSPADGQMGVKQVQAAMEWLKKFEVLRDLQTDFPKVRFKAGVRY